MSTRAEPAGPPGPSGPVSAGGMPPEAPDRAGPSWACFTILVLGFELLVGIVLADGSRLWYDEVWYLRSVPELQRLGLTREFLRGLPGPAGPLYAIVHATFAPLTGLGSPGVRLVTIGLAVLTVLALGAAMRGRGIPYAFPKALGLIGAPMVWGPIGTAMTEIPAVFFYCLSLALFVAAIGRADHRRPGATALGLLAGFACGAAIAGRQYYLFAPLIAPIVCRRGTWRVAMVYALGAAAVVGPVFVAWGNLVPPNKAEYSGFAVRHGLLSLSYAGLVYCIYDASWLFRGWRWKLALVATVMAANLAFGFLELVPFLGAVYHHLSPTLMRYYARAGCGAMMGLGILFAADLVGEAWRRRHDRFFMLLCATAFALLAAPAKNTEMFAGRYVITALPLLVFIAAERVPDSYGKAARLALGCAGGAVSLLAYLNFG